LVLKSTNGITKRRMRKSRRRRRRIIEIEKENLWL